VISPVREVLFLDRDKLPTWLEVTARHFQQVRVETDREVYEILLGTVGSTSTTQDSATLQFVGRILDIVFLDFEKFLQVQSTQRFDNAAVPELSSADDLQLWLITQLLNTIYPGSLCEISETPQSSEASRVLASSVSKPWEPSPWDAPKNLEMLSGYSGRVGVPLIVEEVEEPWTSIIDTVGPEMRYLNAQQPSNSAPQGYSALALPIHLSSGESIGALYVLTPRIEPGKIDVEVRTLTVFSRIIGEIIERQRAAIHTATVSSDIAGASVLSGEQFRASLLDMLRRQADRLRGAEGARQDVRIPFLLLAAHGPEPDEFDPAGSNRLRGWLVETLRHLELRSFLGSHLPNAGDYGAESFIGEIPGVGMMIALDTLVSKDALDRIRNAFPTTINATSPSNAPVRLLAYVLDVPAQRVLDAAEGQDLERLADEVERWAFDVASVVDDVAQSFMLAEQGEWDIALRRVRQALKKDGGRRNGYLYRIAADCSFSLGDWPRALKYAQQGVALSKRELGGGFVRSICQEADAYLCLLDPVKAWDLYTEASRSAPNHPLSRYFRGQGLLLMARLLHEFENEQLRKASLVADDSEKIDAVMTTLVNGAMEDLTSAADLLDQWGLIPESSHYRNFHLIPTMLGQGTAYMLARSPGLAASRLQSARRSFPKDDLFFREFLVAKCWEQGLHTRYGALLLGDEWEPLQDRLREAFDVP
jgi:tetratricopeptide (TPR) repeat protein